jgi:hypothetical protein
MNVIKRLALQRFWQKHPAAPIGSTATSANASASAACANAT